MTSVWTLPLQACDWHEEQEMENFSRVQQQSVVPIQTNPQEYFFDCFPKHALAPIHSLSDAVVQLQSIWAFEICRLTIIILKHQSTVSIVYLEYLTQCWLGH